MCLTVSECLWILQLNHLMSHLCSGDEILGRRVPSGHQDHKGPSLISASASKMQRVPRARAPENAHEPDRKSVV